MSAICRDSAERDGAGGAHRVDAALHLVGLDLFGPVALESEQHRGERVVPGAGRGKGSVEIDSHVVDVVEGAKRAEVGDEPGRRPHGADRMGARRADADGEEFEDADRHPCIAPSVPVVVGI